MEDIEAKLKENEELDKESSRLKVSSRVCAIVAGATAVLGTASKFTDLVQHSNDNLPLTVGAFVGTVVLAGIFVVSYFKARQIDKKIAENKEYIENVKRDHEEANSLKK